MLRSLALVSLLACSSNHAVSPDGAAPDTSPDADLSADWVISIDPSAPAGALQPALLGQYELSGALYRYDQQPQLIQMMKGAGMAEWRVGVGRWEFGTQYLPTLTDGTACPTRPSFFMAPPGSTDLSLIASRDWFTYTDGTPVTVAMTADDTRYKLDYVRSVIDVATAFGAAAYVDIDLMPRALAANQTPLRSNAELANNCNSSFSNKVSNVLPADSSVFAAAVVGLVARVVQGSGGEPGRPVKYWEFWNEPELPYAWDPHAGNLQTWVVTAAYTLTALDNYRTNTSNADGKAIKIGLGSFANAQTAAALIAQAQFPLDFVSFHSEGHDDPLGTLADIKMVYDARATSPYHPNAELVLAEWAQILQNSTLDPHTMDVALHHATVLARAPAYGVTRAHHAIFWDFYAQDIPNLGIVNHDFTPLPAYYAYSLLAQLIGTGAMRLPPAGHDDGAYDSGMGAVLAGKGADGKIRVFLVNRNSAARTARIDLPSGPAMPARVQVFATPGQAPSDAATSIVVPLPPRSLGLIEL